MQKMMKETGQLCFTLNMCLKLLVQTGLDQVKVVLLNSYSPHLLAALIQIQYRDWLHGSQFSSVIGGPHAGHFLYLIFQKTHKNVGAVKKWQAITDRTMSIIKSNIQKGQSLKGIRTHDFQVFLLTYCFLSFLAVKMKILLVRQVSMATYMRVMMIL